jgi:hypothetical protein
MLIDDETIKLKLEAIYQEAMMQPFKQSLYGGSAGFCMFALLYSKHFKDGMIDDALADNLQKILDKFHIISSDTLSNGKAGIQWFYNRLIKWDFIEVDEMEDGFFDDVALSNSAMRMLSMDNYDFLHGALGIAYYLIDKKFDKNFFSAYFQKLEQLFSKRQDGMVANFDFINNKVEYDRVNVGLAHGIVSVLKFCLHCYENNLVMNEAYALAQRIIQYFYDHQNIDKTYSYFPSIVVDNVNDNGGSRLAWCYGDLTIAYVLYQCSVAFKDEALQKLALEMFYHSMDRVTEDRTFVRDAGICHGSSGIAHIYNRMWHMTSDINFKNARDFWIQETLNFSRFDDEISGYKQYSVLTKSYESSAGFLEGSVGIGLVLLSYITDDFDWDYCLMLN